MEFEKEFIEEHKLTDEQVKAVTDHYDTNLTGEKVKIEDEWKVKANKDAESLIDGVVAYAQKQTDFELERNEGEKFGDYMNRFSDKFLESEKTAATKAKTDYEQKIEDFDGGAELKTQLADSNGKLDAAQQKLAGFDELTEKASKTENLTKELLELNVKVAFNSVKPSFPDTVNAYEAKARWGEFQTTTLKTYDVKMVDGEAMYIDKENQYQTGKLSDLLEKDEILSELAKGREQKGTDAKEKELKQIDGIPFDVPADMDKVKISVAIREHLAKQGIDSMHDDYSNKFAELNKKILTPQETAA